MSQIKFFATDAYSLCPHILLEVGIDFKPLMVQRNGKEAHLSEDFRINPK